MRRESAKVSHGESRQIETRPTPCAPRYARVCVVVLISFGAWVVGNGLAVGVRGDEPARDSASFGYRRVMVRPEQIPELARGHLPVSRTEFEQLLQAVQSRLPAAAPVTRIVAAEYVARWSTDHAWIGRALLTVQHQSDQGGALLLEPCTLPIHDARWRADDGGRASATTPLRREPVRLGVSPRGQLTLLLDQSGVLDHAWSLAGQADSNGQSQFSARLPRAAVVRLWVELPADRTLRMEGGAVVAGPAAELTELGAAKNVLELARSVSQAGDARGSFHRDGMRDEAGMPPRLAAPGGAESPDRRWWRVDLGGQDEWLAQVVPAQATAARVPTVVWKQDVSYDVTVSGLELRSALRFDVPAAPLRQLTLAMPAELHVGAIRWGDTSLRWTAQPVSADGWREVVVELPDLTGVDRVLHVTAMAATVLGQPWTLPMLQCRGQTWQETRATVNVIEPLVLQSVDAVDGRQTQVATVAAPALATSGQFQFHSPGGAPRVQIALPPTQVAAMLGASFDLDSNVASVRCAAALDVRRGQLFRVNAELPSAWLVDGVEMLPESLMEDFELTATDDPLRQRLSVRLRTPLTRDETAQLIVHAHRPRTTAEEPLDVDDFQVLSFVSSSATEYQLRRVVGVHAESANRFRIQGDADVPWVTRDSLSPAEAELLEAETTLVFRDGPTSVELRVTPETSTSSFSAQIQIGARVAAGQIREEYFVRCDPRGAPLNRLLILFSQSRPAPLNWSVEGEADAVLSARRLADAERVALTRSAGEAWELLLRTPRTGPFVVTANRDGPWSGALPISLISLPDADFQDGTVRVEGVDVRPAVEHDEVETLPIAESASSGGATVIAAYRYDPANTRPITLSPPAVATQVMPAWAWRARLETLCRESGERRHEVVWRIENRSAKKVAVTLPDGSDAVSLFVDDVPWNGAAPTRPGPRQWSVPLVSGRRFTSIRVVFLTRHAPLATQSRLAPEFPSLDVPVLQRSWRVLMPRSFALLAADTVNAGSLTDNATTWPAELGKRLFGLVLRDSQDDSGLLRGAGATGGAGAGGLEGGTGETSDGSGGEGADESGRANGAFDASSAGRADSADERRAFEVLAASPWPTRTAASLDALERTWRSYDFLAPDDENWGVAIEYRLRGEAWGWALLVFTAGVLATIARRDTALLWGLIPSTAAAAFMVPIAWTAPVSGIFLGTLMAAVLRLASRSHEAPLRRGTSDGSTATTLTATAGAMLLAVVGWHATAHAEDEPGPMLPRVLIATDDEGRPVDEYVHLPRDFYHDLRQRARGLTRPLPEWLLSAAQYRVSAREEAKAPGWNVPAVEATVEVELLRPDQRVVLPVGHVQGTLLSHQVNRNGEAVDASIESSPDGWIVPLREPGFYSITLMLRPRIGQVDLRQAARRGDRMAEAAAGFTLETARIPDSRLTVEVPGAEWDVTIPVGTGRLTRESAGREYQRELGPVSQLTVGVRLPGGNSTSATLVEMDELGWLRVRPGAVTYEVQWAFQTPAARLPRAMRFAVDSRLRLVATAAGAPLKRPLAPTPDGAWWECEWDDTVEARQTLRATFAVTGVAGVGRLRLPRVQALDAQATRRWTAVSVGPQLDVTRSDAPTQAPPSWDEFQREWGAEETAPQMIFRSSGDPDAGILVTYREPQTQVSESLEMSVGARDGSLRYAADLQSTVASAFQYQLRVPENVVVKDVAVTQRDDETNRVLRWSRTADGMVSVLLANPVNGVTRLTLDADFRYEPPGSNVRVPAIVFLSAESTASVVRVYQREDARVSVRRADGAELVAASAEYREGWGRLVCETPAATPAVNNDLTADRLTLSVTNNESRASGTLVTTLLRTAEGYAVGVAGRVVIRDGRLDRLRIEIPEDWGGEFVVNPTIPVERVRSAGQSRQFLVLRPAAPWTSSFDFQLIGPSIGSRDERLSVPDLQFPDLDVVERYLWLPLRDRQRRIVWELSGLQATQLPNNLPVRSWPGLESRSRSAAQDAAHEPKTGVAGESKPNAAVDAKTGTAREPADRGDKPADRGGGEATTDEPIQVAYRVVGSRFRAAVREVEGDVGLSRVLLADHFLTLGPAEDCSGASHFDIAASSLAACEFTLPPGFELVDVRRDQLPAAVIRLEEGRWRLELAASAWPQRVSLVYRGQVAPETAQSSALPFPEIRTLPTLQTLWTVATLPGNRVTWTVAQAGRVLPAEQNLLRLRTINEIVDYGSDALFHAGPNEQRDWFEPWARRRAVLAALTRSQWPADGEANRTWREKFAELDDEYQQVRPTFDATSGGSGSPSGSASGSSASGSSVDGISNAELSSAKRPGLDAADVWKSLVAGPTQANSAPWSVAAANRESWNLVYLRGDSGEARIVPVRRDRAPAWPRWIMACGLLCVAPFTWFAARQGTLSEWMTRWARVLLAAVGLAACAVFPSAPWGVILVVLAILAAVWSPWAIRRPSGSRRER